MKECSVSAGFKDENYKKDGKHLFTHYGIDFDSIGATNFNVLASGDGTVIGVEMNSYNSLGGIVVVKYPNVYIHSLNQVKDLIFRYMHISRIQVSKGDSVFHYSTIGVVSGSHKWWNHIHLEIDSDMTHPFHTPQVAESSSGLLIAAGANDSTLLDPINVLVVGKNQTAIVHPLATYVSAKDKPKYKEVDFISDTFEVPPAPSQTCQKLILPVNNMLITASYKNKKYESLKGNTSTGFMGVHYGVDFCNDIQLWASGNGIVIKTGFDSCFGNFVVIKYENVLNHKTNKIQNVVFRYYHLASVAVMVGDRTTKDIKLGVMGSTGAYSSGIHTHLEADTDITNWKYTPTLVGNTSYFKAGKRGNGDTTFNPLDVLHIKNSAPDNQRLSGTKDGYTNSEDLNTPKL